MIRFTHAFFLTCVALCSFNFAMAHQNYWAKQFGIVQSTYAYSVTTDPFGHVYLLGVYNAPFIGFGTDTLYNQSPNGVNFQTFLAKLDDTGSTIWARNIDKTSALNATHATTDALGNVYISGSYFDTMAVIGVDTFRNADTNGFNPDLFVTKVDSAGNILWTNTINGVGYEWVYDMITDRSGNTYICGLFYSKEITVGPLVLTNTTANDSMADMMVVKFGPDGQVKWAKSAGGTKYEGLNCMAFDPGGNLVMAGSIGSEFVVFGADTLFNPHYNVPFLAKMDTAGNFIWVKKAGGETITWENKIACARSGNIYALGQFSMPQIEIGSDTLINNGVNFDDYFVARYDSTGVPVWARSGGGTDEEFTESLIVDTMEQVFVAGYFRSPDLPSDMFDVINNGSANIYIEKYDSSGANLSATVVGGTATDETYSMCLDRHQNLVISGSITSPAVPIGNDTLAAGGHQVAFVASVVHDTFLRAPQIFAPAMSKVVIYPNPGDGLFSLRADHPLDMAHTTVADAAGKSVHCKLAQTGTSTKNQWYYTLELRGLPSVYYLVTYCGAQRTVLSVQLRD